MARSWFPFLRRASDPSDRSQAQALYKVGTMFSARARHQKALECYEGALASDPDFVEAHYGRGAALAALDRNEEAAGCFERALALKPDFLNAHYGRATALTALNRNAEAIASYDQVLALQPEHIDANYGRGLCLLASGDLPGGFAGYEYRERLPSFKQYVLRVPSPAWWGDASLAGKTILVYPEGGLGDAIQFVRFVPQLTERGARVVLRVPGKLRSLMSGVPGVDRVIADGEPVPPHDFHCPLIRLPLVLGTTLDTIPASRRYLRADTERVAAWGKQLGSRRRPRIGISWAGSNINRTYNQRRSVPLEALRPLADLDCELISLQYPVPKHDQAALRTMPRLDRLGESLTDFGDIAAVIDNLDLVIAIDSAVAHLAGSLGKPVWLLLSYCTEWRWLTDRTDSPWYPTARLFRQAAPGDWAGVVAQVKEAWGQWQAGEESRKAIA